MELLAAALAALADPVRLRAVRALARHELTSGEVAQVLGITPSTVSKHLAQLRDAGITAERRDGRHVHVSLAPAARADARWAAILDAAAAEPDSAGDSARLDDVLRARRETRDGSAARTFVPGKSWAAWARAVAWLVPPGLRVADLGCGDGALTLEVARFADTVVGIDRREAAVRAARALAERRGVRNAHFETGEAASPPLAGGSVDLVVVSQVLHAAEDPATIVGAAHRLLVPGGRVLVLDILPHGEEWVRDRLGHRSLGFPAPALRDLLAAAGFERIEADRAPGRAGDPFRAVLATGVRAGAPRPPKRARSRPRSPEVPR